MLQCGIRKIFVSLQLLVAIFGVTSDQLSSPYEANIPTEDLKDGSFSPVHQYQQPKAGVLDKELIHQRNRTVFNGTLPSLSNPKEEDPVGQTKRVKEAHKYEHMTTGIAYRFNPLSSQRFGIPGVESEKKLGDINEKSNNQNIRQHRTKKEAGDEDQLTPETSQTSIDHKKQPLFSSTQSEDKPILSLNEKQGVFTRGVIDPHGQSAPSLVTSPFKGPPPIEVYDRIPQKKVQGFSPPIKFQNTDPPVTSPEGLSPNNFQNTNLPVISPEGFPPNRFQNTDPAVIPPEDFRPNKFQNTDPSILPSEGFPPNKFQNTDTAVIPPEGFPPNKYLSTDPPVISPEGFPPNKFQNTDSPIIPPEGFPPNKFQNTDSPIIPPEGFPPNKFQNTNPPIMSPESYQPIRFQSTDPPVINPEGFPPNKFQNSFPLNRPQDNNPISLPPDDNDNLPTTNLNPFRISDQDIPVGPSPARENAFLRESTQTLLDDHITSSISSHDNPGDLSTHHPPAPNKQVNSFLQKDPESNIFEPPVYIPTEGAKPDLDFPKQPEPGGHTLTTPLQTETKLHDHSGNDEHISVSSAFSNVPRGDAEFNSGDFTGKQNSDIFLPSTESHASGQFPVAHIPQETEKIQNSDHPQITQISPSLPNLTPSEESNFKISPPIVPPDSEISSPPGQVDIRPQAGISFPPTGGIHTDPFLSNTNFQAPSPHFQPVQAPGTNPLITPFNPYTTLFMPQFGNIGSGGSPFNIFPQTPLFNYPLSGGNFFN